MLETYGTKCTEVFNLMHELGQRCQHPISATPECLQQLGQGITDYLRKIDRAINDIGEAEFPTTKALAARLLQESRTKTWTEFQILDLLRENANLSSRFTDELKAKRLLMLTAGEKERYECVNPPFGGTVKEKFPTADFDLREASKCLALSRYTAAIFHLMRALEQPLRALAKEMGVSTNPTNWGDILNMIEQKLRGGKPPDRHYSQLASHFRLFKDAWRNYTTHDAGAKYHQEEANEIWVSVKAFMQKCAERLSESHGG